MKNTRRSFLTKSLALLGLLPLLNIKKVLATKCPQALKIDSEKVLAKLLDASSKTGKRLAYSGNAEDSKDHKKYVTGSLCGKCKFYNIKKEDQAHAPCSMAGNKYVSSCGWCKTYKLDPKKS
ncbi:MAG: hypothetical protein HN576_14670 [Bacteriovoracaceae bacterium]|jgi:hypothetical protein|nr:hypothetical protein [Bacteriovoracaceae bacterium]